MIARRSRKVRHQRGLTLMELLVVLVILIALAAILVPMLPKMLSRAHTATGATNMAELARFVQTYEQLYQGYPTGFDALVSSSGGIPDYLLVANGGDGNPQLVAAALTDGERDALVNAGVTYLFYLRPTRAELDANGGSPTFDPYAPVPPLDLTTAGTPTVLFASEWAIERDAHLVADPNPSNGDRYVVFGVGKRCTMNGRVMADQPTHFSDTPQESPDQVYARYGLVFKVRRGSNALSRARFVGVVEFHAEGLGSKDGHMEEYYNINRDQ
jgi:prepilin-type N-terminal cleavage/methylation domain-containing protein